MFDWSTVVTKSPVIIQSRVCLQGRKVFHNGKCVMLQLDYPTISITPARLSYKQVGYNNQVSVHVIAS